MSALLGNDSITNLGVPKVEARGLLNFGKRNVAAPTVDEWVLAKRSPFVFRNTVTVGVVGAHIQSLPDVSALQFLQTDVAINR